MKFFTLMVFLLLTFGATVSVTVQASREADDCFTEPNAAPPQGSHWHYRVDRTTHRECWYLGPEDGKVRPHARPAASLARSPSKMSAQPAAQAPAQAIAADVGAAEATPAEAARVEITPVQAKTPEDNSTATLSMRWLDLPKTGASIDHGSASTRKSYADEQSTTDSEDEMPLIWPILTPAELSASGQRPEFTISFAQLGAVLAVVLGLAAVIARMISKLSAMRKPSRFDAGNRWRSASSTRRSGKQAAATVADTAAATYQAGMARRTIKATPPPSDPQGDFEASVRRLLHELQRRAHEHQRREFVKGSVVSPPRRRK
jgi:nucleotide-binding universal stress UspA family protein